MVQALLGGHPFQVEDLATASEATLIALQYNEVSDHHNCHSKSRAYIYSFDDGRIDVLSGSVEMSRLFIDPLASLDATIASTSMLSSVASLSRIRLEQDQSRPLLFETSNLAIDLWIVAKASTE